MKILDRYVITEMLFPFFYGVAAFTVLFMSVSSSELISNMVSVGSKGGLTLFLQYIFSTVPQVLVYTFPMAVLLATLMAFGRLSGDSEIVAMKAGGISFIRIGLPGLFLTFIISLLALYMAEYIVPEANYTATNIVLSQVVKKAGENKQNLVFASFEDGMERRIFAKELDDEKKELLSVVIMYYKDGVRIREIYSPKAVWIDKIWKLTEPRTYDFNLNQQVKVESRSVSGILPVSQPPEDLAKRERKTEEMPREALIEKIKFVKTLSNDASVIVDGKDLDYKKRMRAMEYVLANRLALPFTCFVFGLFGIPLGLRPQRTSSSVGLGLSLVFILFYYILMTAGRILGENGSVSPFLGAWLPNIIFGIFGVYLFINARRS